MNVIYFQAGRRDWYKGRINALVIYNHPKNMKHNIYIEIHVLVGQRAHGS
jgi:hypothetical protein